MVADLCHLCCRVGEAKKRKHDKFYTKTRRLEVANTTYSSIVFSCWRIWISWCPVFVVLSCRLCRVFVSFPRQHYNTKTRQILNLRFRVVVFSPRQHNIAKISHYKHVIYMLYTFSILVMPLIGSSSRERWWQEKWEIWEMGDLGDPPGIT